MLTPVAINVTFDDEIFYLQRRGGISRYFANLIRQFDDQSHLGIETRLTATRTGNESLLNTLPERNFKSDRKVPKDVQRLASKNRTANDALRAWQSGIDNQTEGRILHATYWAPRKSDLHKHRHLAVTVMDLIPELMGSAGFAGKHGDRRNLLERASVIFVISETTRNLLQELFPSVNSPIITTHLGVDPNVFSPNGNDGMKSPFPYILFVGSRVGYKGFDIAVKSVATLRSRGMDVGIIAVGAPPTLPDLSFIESWMPHNRFEFRTANDFQLAMLYRNAELFIFPSDMEGFGLPTLEAMASGCPVVLSNIPIFREVAGDGAFYATANDPESFSAQMTIILNDGIIKQSLITRGLDRGKGFSWTRTAELTASGYRLALQNE